MAEGVAGGGGGGDGGGATLPSFDGPGAAAAGTPGAPVSAAQRMAALDAVAAAMASLASGGPRADSTELARRMIALPALQRVGIAMRSQSVWARFTDGRSLVVPNNLLPAAATSAGSAGPSSALSAAAPAPRTVALQAGANDLQALLVRPQYRQLDMLGAMPESGAAEAAHLCANHVGAGTLPNLRWMARGRGFSLPPIQLEQAPDQGVDNGVEGLRAIAGDGVFFITACAGQTGGEGATSAICTDTVASAANEARYADLLATGALVYAVSWRGGDGSAWAPFGCLAMTPSFVVAAGWRFPVECIGILNLSGGSVLAEWGGALASAGLNNILTWDQPVPWQRLLAYADDLIQIELGTNNFDGRTVVQERQPRLRAYGVGATTEYLLSRGVARDGASGGQVVYLPFSQPAGFVSVLVPTIDYVSIDEDDRRIELVGQFGREAGPFKVPGVYCGSQPGQFADERLARAADAPLADATPVGPRRDWRGQVLQYGLDSGRLDQGGYVQVVNGDRVSNLVQVTFWEVPLQVTSTITGGLTLRMTVTLHLRADVRGWRLQPGGGRAGPIALGCMRSSHADYQASGEISRTVQRDTTTVSWSGAGRVSELQGLWRVLAIGSFDWAARRWSPSVQVRSDASYAERTVVTRFEPGVGSITVSDTTEPQPLSFVAPISAAQPLVLNFDERWQLQAGQFQLADEPVSLLGDRTRTTAISWAAVAPRTPPEGDDVGGV